MKRRTSRLLSILLALCMLLSLLPGTALAAENPKSGSCGTNVTWSIDADWTLTISGTGAIMDYDWSNPLTIWYKSVKKVVIEPGVTRIGNSAFFGCESLTDVTIPGSVTSVGDFAFGGCTSLASVTFPSGVDTIGSSVFMNCAGLKSVTFPNSVTSMGSGTFENCENLTSVTLPAGLKSISSGTFTSCESLKSITIPSGVTSIDNYAFSYAGLTNVTIPSGVTTIGDRAFVCCTDLRSVTIPDGVTSIGESAFELCFSLEHVAIPGSVKTIGKNAFETCEGLTSVTIENGVTTIGDRAFTDCKSLTSLTIPDSVTYIGNTVFELCTSMKSITIPASVTYLGKDPFLSCNDLTDIYYGSTKAQWDSIAKNANISSRTTVHFTNPTVTFDANGGTVSPTAAETGTDGKLSDLPVPARDGYTFDGWYTAVSDGTQVTADTVFSADTTVYAHWTPAVPDPTMPAFTYSFGNNAGAYGYPTPYKIPLARYRLMFGNTQLAEKLYNDDPDWGGNCFGMSSTTSMFFQEGNDISVTGFNSAAALPADLSIKDRNNSWGLTLMEYIEAMQIGQSAADIARARLNNQNELDRLCQAVSDFQRTGSDPVIVEIYGMVPDDKGNDCWSGHAVVGYDVVDVSATESRIMIYDCNFPHTERYITLTKDSSGQYTSWYYRLNDMYHWGTGYSGDIIDYLTYSDYFTLWNDRGGADDVNLLTVNTGSATVTDAGGSVVANIRDGEVLTDRSDVYPIYDVGVPANGIVSNRSGAALWLPTDELYTVSNTDPSVNDFEVTLVNVDQSATVSTTASEVVLGVRDDVEVIYAQLSQASGDSYTITFGSTLKDGSHDVQLTGTADQGTAGLAQIEGKLYTDGVDLGSNATLQIDGAPASDGNLSGQTPDVAEILDQLHKMRNPFTDVAADAYYYDAVMWGVEKDIIRGTTDTTFEPEGDCTRAQIVTLLYRAAGSPAVTASNPFTDVAADAYYYDAVLWAVKNGITRGTTDTTFSPDDTCTRAQAVTFLHRTRNCPPVVGGNRFTDLEPGAYYRGAVQWAVSFGVVNGVTDTTFEPNSTCTRAQIVTILYRSEKLIGSDTESPSPDSSTSGNTYAVYKGVDYTLQTTNPARIRALDKAKQMVTLQWTAPCDFPTWTSDNGVCRVATSNDGTSDTMFIEGKTYTGIPYSMSNHSYDDIAWIALLNKGITTSSMTARYYSGVRAGTAKGIDCSYFVYTALIAANTGYKLTYQNTPTMLRSSYYTKISVDEMKPGDLFLKNGHVMMFVGRSDDNYAVFEAAAAPTKCTYSVYSREDLSSYSAYKFKGFAD